VAIKNGIVNFGMDEKKVMLIILDGWGIGLDEKVSAISQANTPNVDRLIRNYPNAELVTFGEEVGLPEGQMGNSEVGHLNIGAGRVVYQELARINKSIREKELHVDEKLIAALKRAKSNGKKVHLMGLISDGGVHSHINHLLALIDILEAEGIEKGFIHGFTDGRDVSPTSGKEFIRRVTDRLEKSPVRLASLVGRYYAMDRDKRWERIRLAYDLMVRGKGILIEDKGEAISLAIQTQYDEKITDEFLNPIQIVNDDQEPIGNIDEGDLLLCFNFRTDRPRQISEVLTQEDHPEENMQTIPLEYLTMTNYNQAFKGITVLFEKSNLTNTLGEVISNNGLSQVRIAETEKYPHVTFFFSGGREQEFERESRIVIPSPKVATYDLQPEMSAELVTTSIIEKMQSEHPNFVCLNFANTDMVGHTGIMEAAVVAAEKVDDCVGRIVEVGLKDDYEFIIIADHGNSEVMTKPDGSPHTAHTTNMVPVIFVSEEKKNAKISNGKLGDIAPTICHLLNIIPPEEMDGNNLLNI